jgi:hypothetical protein
MTTKEISIGIGIAAIGGVLVTLFQHFFLSNPPSNFAKGPVIYVNEWRIPFFGYTGLSYVSSSSTSRQLHMMIAYRLYTDSEIPLSIEVSSQSKEFIGGVYSYGRDDTGNQPLTKSIKLTILPGDYLNIFGYWSVSRHDNQQLYFKSSEAVVVVDRDNDPKCTFHPYLGNTFCE